MKPVRLGAAAVAAVAVLSACSQAPTASATHPASQTPAPSTSASPAARVSCPRLYRAWRLGPARKFAASLAELGSSSAGQDLVIVRRERAAIASAARSPIPPCADPKGYWTALLMHISAVESGTNSAAGRKSDELAMKIVPTLGRKLRAELSHTTPQGSES